MLAAFGLLTAVAVWWAMRPRPPWFSRVIARTLHSSGQFAVRLVVLMLAVMLGISQVLGLDTLLGAFAAGLITRLVLHGSAPESADPVLEKVEAMGFGFLVPVFFVVTGIEFDLDALLPAAGHCCSCPSSSCCSCWSGAFRWTSSPRATSYDATGARSPSSRPPRCRWWWRSRSASRTRS
ncbi:cation:proton antiporter domain-containing protein [Streptomyces fulvoviolaceus]|uniref:cation:proton antiporter domain-containing protein n=1 Tax=Streptomyces fulvoviolaceus TaxID=285535 RepID=UPI0036F3DF89